MLCGWFAGEGQLEGEGVVLEEEFPPGQSNTESADSRELLKVQLPLWGGFGVILKLGVL